MAHAQGPPIETPASFLEDIREEARVVLLTLYRYTINPRELFEREAIPVSLAKFLLSWLRPLEAIMRLMLMAMAKTIQAAPPPLRTRKQRKQRPRGAFTARFKWARRAKPETKKERQERPPPLFDRVVTSSIGLAERFEGLARVIDDPAPYAKRLAQRLAAKPQEIPEALAEAPPGPTADVPLRDIWRELHRHVRVLYETVTEPPAPQPQRDGPAPPHEDSS